MKDLSPDDRPREKLRRHGAAALGDNELVAIVLGTGSERADALAVANRTLGMCGGVHGLLRSSLDDTAVQLPFLDPMGLLNVPIPVKPKARPMQTFRDVGRGLF